MFLGGRKMNFMEAVPVRDWLALAIGVFGLVMSYLQSRDRLPAWARQWLAKIGRDKVEEAVEYAARLSQLSDDEKRKEAVQYLIRLSEKELGFAIPESIANLLVEYVYQRWKGRG
jgi:hypothetical protein